jgi:hypothetical protein
VLFDEGVDQVEVLDRGIPDLEQLLGRQGDDPFGPGGAAWRS